jgi:hypothetical protein
MRMVFESEMHTDATDLRFELNLLLTHMKEGRLDDRSADQLLQGAVKKVICPISLCCTCFDSSVVRSRTNTDIGIPSNAFFHRSLNRLNTEPDSSSNLGSNPRRGPIKRVTTGRSVKRGILSKT